MMAVITAVMLAAIGAAVGATPAERAWDAMLPILEKACAAGECRLARGSRTKFEPGPAANSTDCKGRCIPLIAT